MLLGTIHMLVPLPPLRKTCSQWRPSHLALVKKHLGLDIWTWFNDVKMLYNYKKTQLFVYYKWSLKKISTFLRALPPLASPCCGSEASDRLTVSSPSVFCTGQELLALLTGLFCYVQQVPKNTHIKISLKDMWEKGKLLTRVCTCVPAVVLN